MVLVKVLPAPHQQDGHSSRSLGKALCIAPAHTHPNQDTLKPFGNSMAASMVSHTPCHASLALLTCEQSVASSWK